MLRTRVCQPEKGVFQSERRRTAFAPSRLSIYVSLVLAAMSLGGCGQSGSSVLTELQPFGRAVEGAGRIRYANSNNGKLALDVELTGLEPAATYFLCFNALRQDLPENDILGTLPPDEGWPGGRFSEHQPMGEKEGYWDFAAISADGEGQYHECFQLPLPARGEPYRVKFLVKRTFAPFGDDEDTVILQAPDLRFYVRPWYYLSGGERVTVLLAILGVLVAGVILFAGMLRLRKRQTALGQKPNTFRKTEARRSPTDSTPPVAEATANAFLKTDKGWEITFNGETVDISSDAKGFDYIHILIQEYVWNECLPKSVKALDLQLAVMGATPAGSVAVDATIESGELHPPTSGDSDCVPDSRAFEEYRKRYDEVSGELDQARKNNDLGNIEKLEGELAELLKEIEQSGPRAPRRDVEETARKSVCKAVRAAIGRIGTEGLATLADHLGESVNTGNESKYDPRDKTEWEV